MANKKHNKNDNEMCECLERNLKHNAQWSTKFYSGQFTKNRTADE